MPTLAEHQRTCSYCGGPAFPTTAAFSAHWSKCPVRIRAGYIPTPTEMLIEEIAKEHRLAQKHLDKAKELELELQSRNEPPASQST